MSVTRKRKQPLWFQWRVSTARVLSLPLCIAHTKPSFWKLSLKWQRHLLRGKLAELGVRRNVALAVTRTWRPDPTLQPSAAVRWMMTP